MWVNYFNIGVDAKIALEVEKRRGRTRCANYFQISWLMPLYLFGWGYTDVRKQIKKVISYKKMPNGEFQEKVVADSFYFTQCPINIVGFNLNSGFGNFVTGRTWVDSANRVIEPDKALRRLNQKILETSCDESESMLKQDIADDKIELMSHITKVDVINGEMSRVG